MSAGIYIKGMKMPDTCWNCLLFSGNCCKATGSIVPFWTNNLAEKPGDCPLVEVKDQHGRLISAKLLKADFTGNFIEAYPTALVHAMIDDAPTIIPAEEG